ncbi:acyl-CoA N-acyltransferase [Zychaea mexicana]|uniref:acyl-CoA N-acyltransferase n=1 Tax=Zychaea mexicana TaxID=64656 RepID=UPI0022FEC9E8|nr:acyl-CoA N-acyltransferase [Zychaea mexicana]XP_052975305.1 acyl-CoA N-acyltransferase [Zychaea mexicana]KAI9489037.1 acyl-CoA N-acyltransferase [Zychaea mexicana]KAI9489040.1 acyl-CoA N-acyltransferase [Zychaea mexicana]
MGETNKRTHIRKATPDDIYLTQSIVNLVNRTFRSDSFSDTEIFPDNERVTFEDIETLIVESGGKSSALWFAFDQQWVQEHGKYEEVIVGAVKIGPYNFRSHKDSCILEIFAISPEYRKRGLGSFLAQEALKYAKESGYTTAYLMVLDSKPKLLDWCRRALGFEEIYTVNIQDVIRSTEMQP